jgi:hypothetical protein
VQAIAVVGRQQTADPWRAPVGAGRKRRQLPHSGPKCLRLDETPVRRISPFWKHGVPASPASIRLPLRLPRRAVKSIDQPASRDLECPEN